MREKEFRINEFVAKLCGYDTHSSIDETMSIYNLYINRPYPENLPRGIFDIFCDYWVGARPLVCSILKISVVATGRDIEWEAYTPGLKLKSRTYLKTYDNDRDKVIIDLCMLIFEHRNNSKIFRFKPNNQEQGARR